MYMSKKNNIYIKKAKKRRFIRKLFISILVFIIISGILMFKTNIFIINNVEYSGDNLLTKDYVLEKTESLKGENIFSVSQSSIEKLLMENPYVKTVSLKKKFPKSLVIDVTEASGLYYISNDGDYSIISKELVLLEKVTSVEGKGLIEIKGIDITGKNIGDKIDENTRIENLLEEFYKEEEVIRENGEGFSITAIEIKDLSQIKSYINQIEVRLGNDENIRNKMSNAIKVYKSGLVTEYINVSFDGSPHYK